MRICFILVEPENPGNIGSSARAMKNMGFSDLRLVRPPAAWRTKAGTLAVSAQDVLEKARVFKTLEDALSDVHWALAATRRLGAKRGIRIAYDKAVEKIAHTAPEKRAALVFGKESKGLDNGSLALCDRTLTIPAHSDYPSLNLAQAVMVTAFSVFSAAHSKEIRDGDDLKPWVSKAESGAVLEQFKETLELLGYRRDGAKLVERIAVMFSGILKRSHLFEDEARMFRGFFRRIRERASQK